MEQPQNISSIWQELADFHSLMSKFQSGMKDPEARVALGGVLDQLKAQCGEGMALAPVVLEKIKGQAEAGLREVERLEADLKKLVGDMERKMTVVDSPTPAPPQGPAWQPVPGLSNVLGRELMDMFAAPPSSKSATDPGSVWRNIDDSSMDSELPPKAKPPTRPAKAPARQNPPPDGGSDWTVIE